MSSKDKGKSDIFTALLKTVYPQKLSPDISVTRNFFVFWKLLAPDLHGKKKSLELLSCLGTNNQRLQSSFEDKMATQKGRKIEWVKPSSPYIGLMSRLRSSVAAEISAKISSKTEADIYFGEFSLILS